MIKCPFCQTQHVANTLFCNECGVYLLEEEELGTDPFQEDEITWLEETDGSQAEKGDLGSSEPLTIRLRILDSDQSQELEVPLIKPIRLGRLDPSQNIYPEVDLTAGLGREHGVSRMHACIYQRANFVVVEDLASTNGTLLNGQRLAPYLPAALKNGDHLQLGKLLIEVSFAPRSS